MKMDIAAKDDVAIIIAKLKFCKNKVYTWITQSIIVILVFH